MVMTRWYILYDDAGTPKREIVNNLYVKGDCVYFLDKTNTDTIIPLSRVYKIARLKQKQETKVC